MPAAGIVSLGDFAAFGFFGSRLLRFWLFAIGDPSAAIKAAMPGRAGEDAKLRAPTRSKGHTQKQGELKTIQSGFGATNERENPVGSKTGPKSGAEIRGKWRKPSNPAFAQLVLFRRTKQAKPEPGLASTVRAPLQTCRFE